MYDIKIKLISGDMLFYKEVEHFNLDGDYIHIVIDFTHKKDSKNNIFVRSSNVLYIKVKEYDEDFDLDKFNNKFTVTRYNYVPDVLSLKYPRQMIERVDTVTGKYYYVCPHCGNTYDVQSIKKI